MANNNSGYCSSIDGLSLVAKVLLVIFLDVLIYGIYRICSGKVLLGILWIITGGLFGIGWIIDIVCVIQHGKPTVLA